MNRCETTGLSSQTRMWYKLKLGGRGGEVQDSTDRKQQSTAIIGLSSVNSTREERESRDSSRDSRAEIPPGEAGDSRG